MRIRIIQDYHSVIWRDITTFVKSQVLNSFVNISYEKAPVVYLTMKCKENKTTVNNSFSLIVQSQPFVCKVKKQFMHVHQQPLLQAWAGLGPSPLFSPPPTLQQRARENRAAQRTKDNQKVCLHSLTLHRTSSLSLSVFRIDHGTWLYHPSLPCSLKHLEYNLVMTWILLTWDTCLNCTNDICKLQFFYHGLTSMTSIMRALGDFLKYFFPV